MKQGFKQIGSFFGSILLIIVAIVLFVILSIVGFCWSFFTLFYKRTIGEALTGAAQYFKAIALSIDQLGNVAFAGLLNDVLIDKTLIKLAHNFGDEDETISEVLGWNKLTGALSPTGIKLVKILNFIDKNHVEDAAQSAYDKALEKINKYENII